ncbi:MAG: ROK family transcriptional regulator [Nocardioides sp.]
MVTSVAPGSTASLRTANQQRVLDVLRGRGIEDYQPNEDAPITQADLARMTGLAPATVSNIVRELAGAGLLDTVPGSGRRGTEVRLATSAGTVVGLDFGHSHVAVALGDLTGRLLAERREPIVTGHDHHAGLTQAAALVDGILAEAGQDRSSIRGMTMGLPAPITHDVVRSTAILPGWVGVNARLAVREAFGLDVHVENDANLGALAEHRQGVARGHDTSVFVKISSGIGAGLILNNQLFRGDDGTAGEIGHLTLDEQGPVCRCGSRGCLETYASVSTLQTMMATQLPGASLDTIVAAARDGNISALRSLEDAGLHLGWGLAAVVNLLNPSTIVVGGDMARAGEFLLGPVRIGLRRHALDAVATTPVLASALGERASLVGAVLLAAERTNLLAD